MNGRFIGTVGGVLLLISIGIECGGQSFTSSNLPIIVITTQATIVDDPKVTATMGIIDNGPGVRNNTTDAFNDFSGTIGIEIRGSSSQGFPKKQYSIEVRDENGEGIDAPLLGLPKKDDWVLFAPYNDKTLMRDVLAYHLGRTMGDYASRSRYCELILNGSYEGVYVLLEKIKRDKNRVNIDKLEVTEITGDDLTGGYIIKIDKTSGSGGEGWTSGYAPPLRSAGQTIYFQYEYPKPEEMAPDQKNYIKGYVDQFEKALQSDDFKDPALGYAHFIDVPSFVDYFLANEVTKNADAYRLSTFFYKKKDSDGGKLYMGPIWDFNLGFGNVNYCTQGNPEGLVINFNSICADDYWLIPFWWDRLFKDDAFKTRVSDRWKALRSGPFQTATILSYVDSVASSLNESQQRNFVRWPVLGVYVWPNYYVGNSFADELSSLKAWITQRLAWLDNNLPAVITGVAEKPDGFHLNVYPNPFAQDLQIDYTIDRPGLLRLDFFDVLGRKLDHRELQHADDGPYSWSVSTWDFTPGMYVMKAYFGDHVVTQRIIKTK